MAASTEPASAFQRILELLDSCEIAGTFFVPGHTVESFPAETESILEAGHEVAHHSYAHVDPSRQTRDEERADMERAWRTLERIGVAPLGFRSPSADLSGATLELVEELGFLYDSSLMADDWMHEHVDGGVLTVCMHPQVIGRGHRVAMLERFVRHCVDAGARFERMGDVARALPPAPGSGRTAAPRA